ncbi:MAG: carboxypeptidase regulatory-like domain-containing protein [Planctomycetia bacterium]|nr:carboxypeptidase regulatory-like domain-containing protein [Planctomycetia bacterium]
MGTRGRTRSLLAVSLLVLAALAWWLATPPAPPEPAVPAPVVAAPDLPPLPLGAPSRRAAEAGPRDRPVATDGIGTDAPDRGEPGPAERPSFRAVVVDAAERPVAGAAVYLMAPSPLGGVPAVTDPVDVTDDEGRFALVGAEEPLLRVRVRAPGLVQVGSETALERGTEARIRLVPAADVRVRVVEAATGLACADALVWILSGEMASAVFATYVGAPRSDQGRTDASGRITLASEVGRAVLFVAPRRGAATSLDLVVEPRGREVEVKITAGGRVEGHVVDARGVPVPSALVRLDVPPAYRREVAADDTGRFAFDDVPAEYLVTMDDYEPAAWVVAVGGSSMARGWVEVLSAVDRSVATVTVALADAVIRGRVVAADGRGAGGRMVRARLVTPSLDDAIAAVDGVADADGAYHLSGAVPGEWMIEVLGGAGARAAASVAVRVPARGEAVAPDLVLPDRSGRLRFRVVDASERPVAGAEVEVRARLGVVNAVEARGATDAAGAYASDGLPLEGVTLHVRVPASAWWLVEVAAADLTAASAVVLRLPSGTCGGRVRRLDGSPHRARLRAGAIRGPFGDAGLPLDPGADGGFRFRGVSASPSCWVESADEAWVLLPVGLRLEPGREDLRAWAVTPSEAAGLHLRLVVVDADGAPLSIPWDARVELTPTDLQSPSPITVVAGAGAAGSFESAVPLPPGTYDGVLHVPGYRDAPLQGIRLPATERPPTVHLAR